MTNAKISRAGIFNSGATTIVNKILSKYALEAVEGNLTTEDVVRSALNVNPKLLAADVYIAIWLLGPYGEDDWEWYNMMRGESKSYLRPERGDGL